MKIDQWFEPGDKVMRVKYNTRSKQPLHPKTEKGIVLCVEHCEQCEDIDGSEYVGLDFVGVESDNNFAFCASCFRKVDEIKLCLAAVKKQEKEMA